ncbi:hypothetical protein Fmac_028584 [Flemingia macrophylla]|uniref:Uncharacterized protein n=1 Tax=Flemingia macrophylla TaxID=520843 RepID=A0ABD1L7X4_9FABA
MTTILVSILLRSNLEWMSILRLMLQTPIAYHHSNRDKALNREDGSQLLAFKGARNDAIVIRGVHDVATDTSAETRKLEGKLDALVNLLTQLAANQKPASVARVCADHHSSRDKALDREDGSQLLALQRQETMPLSLEEFMMWLRDTSTKTRKLEGRLDAIVNLVTQLAANQKPASVKTSIVAETRHLIEKIGPNYYKFSARIDAIVIRGVHNVATDTSAETRKLEGKLNALLNLVTQLAANQ